MKKILTLLLIFHNTMLLAQTSIPEGWYIGINPLSYTKIFPWKEEIKRFGPILAGNEYGINLVGGYYFNSRLSAESRVSLGNIHQVAFVGQLHAGVNYHFLYSEGEKRHRGLYAGAYVKYWDYANRLTKVHFYNIAPYFALGNMWNSGRFIYDLRLSQTVAIHTWTSLSDTRPGSAWFFSPWPRFIPVLPGLCFTIGYHLKK